VKATIEEPGHAHPVALRQDRDAVGGRRRGRRRSVDDQRVDHGVSRGVRPDVRGGVDRCSVCWLGVALGVTRSASVRASIQVGLGRGVWARVEPLDAAQVDSGAALAGNGAERDGRGEAQGACGLQVMLSSAGSSS